MKMKKSYLLIIFGILLVFFGMYVFISSFDKGTPTFSVKLLNKEEANFKKLANNPTQNYINLE